MTYRPVISKLRTEHLIQMLMKSLPVQDLGQGASVSAISDSELLSSIIPFSYYSSNNFITSLRRILFHHIDDNRGRDMSIAAHKEQIAQELSDLRIYLSDYILNEQQKEMSLDFFENLDSSRGKRRPSITRKANYNHIRTGIDSIEQAFILFERYEHAKMYIHSADYSKDLYAGQRYSSHDLKLTSKDQEVASILLDGGLIYNAVCMNEVPNEMPRYCRLLSTWCLSALGYLRAEDYKLSHESLGDTVSTESVVLALAALINKALKDKACKASEKVTYLIEVYLSSDDTYPTYSEQNKQRIRDMATLN